MTGPLRLDAGTSGVPALAFSAETTTGLYRAGTNDVRFAVATVDVLQLTASGVTLPLGTANGVLYLNGSKVATSGAALSFDGTNVATTGTASATKLIPTGGTATGNGMYLPAANTLGFSTNGVLNMSLDASGNLGIGTASPGAKLEVYGGASGTNTNMLVGNAATAFQIGVDPSNNCQIRTAQAVPILFYTSAAQRMSIDANGNIFGTAGTTSMTNGFFYIPGAAGVPSGTPTAVANRFPAYVDTTNNRLYIHNGTSWRYASLV
jgi:hypothetical protein